VKGALLRHLNELDTRSIEEVLKQRAVRLRGFGVYSEV
jgi:acetyl-CoA carboxylase alpha subunit